MVSNMKKTLAGVALAALPLMASAQMDQMQDSALANVSGQLGIIDITNIGFGVALFDVPGAIGPALIDPIDLGRVTRKCRLPAESRRKRFLQTSPLRDNPKFFISSIEKTAGCSVTENAKPS